MLIILHIHECLVLSVYCERLVPIRQHYLYLADIGFPRHVIITSLVHSLRAVIIEAFEGERAGCERHSPVEGCTRVTHAYFCLSELAGINVSCRKHFDDTKISIHALQFCGFLPFTCHGKMRLLGSCRCKFGHG